MAARFWVGGSGNWSDTTHWSTTTGGSSGAAVPTSSDDVTLDSNSGTSATVTINVAANANSITINKSDITLLHNFGSTVVGLVTLTTGILNTNGQTCSWGGLSTNNSNTRTLTFGASAITITGSLSGWNVVTNLSITTNTATLTFTGVSASFGGGGGPNWNGTSFVVNGGGSCNANIGGSIIKNFTFTGTASKNDSISLNSNITVTGVFTITGNSAINRVLLQTSTFGVQRIYTINGSVSLTNVDFMDIKSAGTAGTWTGTSLGDCGGNSGITFDASVQQTWSGTSGGNWSTNAWTTRVPLPQDDVVISSAFTATQTVTADMPRLGRSITWAGATGSPTWSINNANNQRSYGNITLILGMTLTGSTNYYLMGRSAYTITNAGQSWPGLLDILTIGGTYTLNDAINVPNNALEIDSGTFTANNFNVTVQKFVVQSLASTINMGTGTWTVNGTSGTVWSTSNTVCTLNISSAQVNFSGSGSASITTGGVSMPSVNFTGAGGTDTFNDAFTTTGTIFLTAGTLATGNNNVTTAILNLGVSGAGVRTFTPGSSIITITNASNTNGVPTVSSNLTISANTSIFLLTANNAQFTPSNINYNGASIVYSGSGTGTLGSTGGTPTFANIVRAGTAVKTDVMTIFCNPTVTGGVAFQGNSSINRVLIQSSVLGTQRTITNTGASATAAITLTGISGSPFQTANVDLMDIAFSTAVDLSAITGLSGDCQGNAGITFTTAQPQFRNTTGGVWSDSTMWSQSSGGASNGRVPLPQDNVNFDSNSGSSFSIDMPRLGKDINFIGYTGTATWSIAVTSYGNFTFASTATMIPGGNPQHTFGGRGNQTITSAGAAWTNIQINAPGGIYTQLDSLITSNNNSIHNAGTYASNNFTLTTGNWTAASGTTINMGSSTWNLLRVAAGNVFGMSGTIINAISSTIVIAGPTVNTLTFAGGSQSYGTLQYTTANSPGILNITGGNYFDTLNVSNGPKVIQFPIGNNTNTIKSWAGTSGTITSGYIYLPGLSGTAFPGSYVSTPDASALDITGDIDIQAYIVPDIIQVGGIVSKASNTNVSYQLLLNNQSIQFRLSANGTTLTDAIIPTGGLITAGQAIWVRATWQQSSKTATAYTGGSGATPSWVSVGTSTINIASIANTSTSVTVGGDLLNSHIFQGKVYKVFIYNVIGGTTPVASPDFTTTQTGLEKSYTDAQSNIWTVNGAVNGLIYVTSSTPGTQARINQPYIGPSGMTYTLNNAGSRLAHTPFLSLPGFTGSYASTPDSASFDITGDIDLRVQAALPNWLATSVYLISKYNASGSFSYILGISSGKPFVTFSQNGTVATQTNASTAVPYALGVKAWIRATWQQSTGNVIFYTSNDGTNWTQLGTTQNWTSSGIFSSSAEVELGAWGNGGNGNTPLYIWYAQILNGINGTVAGTFDASLPNGGSSPSWTMNGRAIIEVP